MPSGKAFNITITGTENVKKALASLGTKAPFSMGAALWQEATQIMVSAKAITPFDTGILRGSGHVQLPKVSGNSASVVLGFGGAASEYAIYVHENPHARHTPPTQHKFLEQPLMAAQSGMAERLAKRLRSMRP